MSTLTKDPVIKEACLPLKVYLNDKLIQLDPYQIQRITEIIDTCTPQKDEQLEQIKYKMKSEFVYRFDANFTFLHWLCGQQKSQKIKQIANHPITLLMLILQFILSFLFSYILGYIRIGGIPFIIWILWLFLKHLLLNKTAVKLCVKSFDFWIKICYGFMFVIAWGLNSGPITNLGWYFNAFIMMLFTLMIISYIASFDATHSSKTKKLIISIFASLFFSLSAIGLQFASSEEDYHTINMKSALGMHTISTLSLSVSSSRILSIFFWKQSYKTWKSKGIKAVALTRTPTIIWFDSAAQEKQTADIDQSTITDDVDNDKKRDIISVNEMTAHISLLSSVNKPPSSP